MASDPSLPLDLAACHELIRRQQRDLEARQQQLEERQRQLEERQQQLEENRRVLDEVDASYQALQQERDLLKAELEQFRRWVYGRRTERIRPADGQRHLFELEEGVLPLPLVQEGSLEDAAASPRRKKRRSQKDKLANLPTRIIPLDVPEDEKRCDTCGREKAKIGEDERRVLHYRPAVLEVEVYVLPKYACTCCQSGVVSPPPPERILPRSIAGPGLIAEILVSKFYDHLPLYRQEDRFTRWGLYLSRSTLCDWAGAAADLLKPLYDRMVKLVLSSDVIWTDDTPVRMLDPKAEGGSRLARFWTYISEAPVPYSVYDFTESWKRDGPASFLKDYHGTMHADAYGGYDGIITGSNGAIVRVACGAHIRRKFEQAKASAPRESAQMLEWFRQLYDIEDRVREFSPEDRCVLRRLEALPILFKMKAHLDELQVRTLPKSKLGQAVTYARNQWSAFCLYVEDGRRTIDNNVSERTLRPQAIGRRNWLFLGHESAGPRAAVLFTILAGAKRHHLEPWAYVTDVLVKLAAETDDLDTLLPDRWAASHPEQVLHYRLEEARQKRARQKATRTARRRAGQ
jgi:transposase